jgi:hypothetical protein
LGSPARGAGDNAGSDTKTAHTAAP